MTVKIWASKIWVLIIHVEKIAEQYIKNVIWVHSWWKILKLNNFWFVKNDLALSSDYLNLNLGSSRIIKWKFEKLPSGLSEKNIFLGSGSRTKVRIFEIRFCEMSEARLEWILGRNEERVRKIGLHPDCTMTQLNLLLYCHSFERSRGPLKNRLLSKIYAPAYRKKIYTKFIEHL